MRLWLCRGLVGRRVGFDMGLVLGRGFVWGRMGFRMGLWLRIGREQLTATACAGNKCVSRRLLAQRRQTATIHDRRQLSV